MESNTQELTLNIELIANENKILCADNCHIIVITSTSNKKISYDIRILTEAGKQIIHLINPSLDIHFMEKLSETLATKYDVKVSMHEVLYREGDSYHYKIEPIWIKSKNGNAQ